MPTITLKSTSAAKTYHSWMSLRFPNGPSGERRQRVPRSMLYGPSGSRARWEVLQPVVAVGPVLRLFDDEEDHLRERQRQQREVDPVQAHGECADEQRQNGRRERCTENGEPQIRMLRHQPDQQERGNVAAAAVEHRVAVREQSGVAEQQVEADRRDAHDDDLRGQARVAVDRVKREREEREAESGQQGETHAAVAE